MSSKKEDDRNEKIIRGLMKLPPNRRCINCNCAVIFFFFYNCFCGGRENFTNNEIN